ncbi:MucR family transcriptional regulator [Hyphococcus luteus]|uniref:MucR family transcriptional regulator n=1 Tax=Hyphococcus luteus TaxID=2058213 RepID=A0A2S7K3X1_9PROT|nr:MucR family transcriptional regulator [Marinicaulis flavus]PQA87181.1 MucR family transcriptional regulator [Marinicaulis flavus]
MSGKGSPPDSNEDALRLAGNIVAAYVGNNKVGSDDLPSILQEVFEAVNGLSEGGQGFPSNRQPAVPVNKSVTADYIICLEDGKKLKMLKRYLRTHYNMSPEEYRRKWKLPADYPMTAPNYAKRRSKLAKDIGLGTASVSKKKRPAAKTKTRAKRKTAAR